MGSLKEARGGQAGLVGEIGELQMKLGVEEQASKQRRQALDEAKHRTAELDARIESLVSQLSTANQENDGLRNTARGAESPRTILVQELDTTNIKLLEEQKITARIRKDVSGTQTELATLQAILAQTQQELQANLKGSTDQATCHNLKSTELRRKIKELETQPSVPFSRKLTTSAKKLVKQFGNLIGVPGGTQLTLPIVGREGEPR